MPETSPSRRSHSSMRHKVPNLERKRQTDRESQRVVRERTKRYITYLENLVDTLQTSQQDERLQSMTLRCKVLHEENEQLRNSIHSITRIIKGVELPDQVENNAAGTNPELAVIQEQPDSALAMSESPPTAQLHHEQLQPQDSSLPVEQNSLKACAGPLDPNMRSPIPAPENFAFNILAGQHRSAASPANEASEGSQTNSDYGIESSHVYVIVNNLLSKAENFTMPMAVKPDQDSDIAIRAVALGWPQTAQRYELDPTWEVVRQIDQDIFFCCGPVERLGILRVMRWKLLQQMTSSNQQQIQTHLPPYMHSRPLQNFITHPSLIDYFVWPELREFLILNSQKMASNHIAATFASSLRFIWPWDLSDVWTRNRVTGLYAFSKLFDERFNDIRSWALTHEFFDLYPEMSGYIPCYDPTSDLPPGT